MNFRHLALVVAMVATSGCDDHLLGDPIVTDTGPLYASDWQGVQDLFEQRCVSCHREGGSGGFDLTVVIEAEQTDGDPSNDYYVLPGNAGASNLWQSVAHSGTAVKMPFDKTEPLDDNEIKHIEEWINAGAAL